MKEEPRPLFDFVSHSSPPPSLSYPYVFLGEAKHVDFKLLLQELAAEGKKITSGSWTLMNSKRSPSLLKA
jgi:hypothetical protein